MGSIPGLQNRLNRRFRRRRMLAFAEAFGIGPGTRVVDVGGSRYLWSMLPEHLRPRPVLVNLLPPPPGQRDDGAVDVVADARRLPFADDAFDVAFSNSLVDHLHTFEQQAVFAAEVRRVAKRYYVQSPHHWFPVEPHLLTPFVHWLPAAARVRLLRDWTLWGRVTRPSPERCAAFVREVRMLTVPELRRLFPEAELWRERALGLTKSIMAVRR